jgi:hypothetical protein
MDRLRNCTRYIIRLRRFSDERSICCLGSTAITSGWVARLRGFDDGRVCRVGNTSIACGFKFA